MGSGHHPLRIGMGALLEFHGKAQCGESISGVEPLFVCRGGLQGLSLC